MSALKMAGVLMVLNVMAVFSLCTGAAYRRAQTLQENRTMTDQNTTSVGLQSPKDIWSDCGSSGDVGHIVYVHIQPDPPIRGQNLSINVNISLDETVTSGSVKVQLVYEKFFPAFMHTYNLCSLITAIDRHCPLQPGVIALALNATVNAKALKGDYSGKALATDQKGDTVFCIKIDFRL